jgi:hypothetical protein
MKNYILYILFLVSFISCQKEEPSTLEYLNGSYTYNYSFWRLNHYYNENINGYSITETKGSETRQIEIASSPYSEKEFVIINLLNKDSTYVYWPENKDTFIIMNNSTTINNVTGNGFLQNNKLHFNVEFSDISGFDKLDGIAIKN